MCIRDSLHVDIRADELVNIRQQLEDQNRQRVFLVAGATAFLSGVLVLTLATTTWPGWLLLASGAVLVASARGR